jgi:hypothetical protein
MDVDSYLPYEGKVVLKNKGCREVFVRMPLWVEKKSVGCHIAGKVVRPEWIDRHLCLDHLKAGDVVTIEFPVEETVERWTVDSPVDRWFGVANWQGKTTYTCRFRGNTLVEISPPLFSGVPLYQRRPEKYRRPKASMKRVTRFKTPLVLKW